MRDRCGASLSRPHARGARSCSPSFPGPGTCAPSLLTGATARCQAVTPALQALISATPRQLPAMWRIASWDPSMSTGEEEEEYSWADNLLGMSTAGHHSARCY